MPNALHAYYDATATMLAGPHSQHYMSATTACLKKTYIMMQSALGTEASLEIGARGAEYSLEMANAYGRTIALCALEASPRTHAYFSKKVDYKHRGVSYIHALVSDRDDEEVVFYEYMLDNMEAASGLSSILVRDAKHHGATRRIRSAVKSICGDTFIENKFKHNKNIALWIDVEGAQFEVLNSLLKSFDLGIISSIYIEVERIKLWPEQKMLDNDVLEFMNEHNFSQFLCDNESKAQYNIIFINNNIENCDFSVFFDYYHMLLQKAHTQ